MQSFHAAGHDLELLESFVHDCIQQLPKLQGTTDLNLPPRCSTYHTTCSCMLKQALLVLEQLSPRICRLLAQIWDLTSLNFFVIIQLAHSAVEENEQFRAKCRNAERFHLELAAQQTARHQRHEAEVEKLRVECQGLRAELQKTRQKQNRLAVENTKLRQAISGLIDTHEPIAGSGAALSGGGVGVAHIEFEDDVAVVGDAEEREFYGVDGDALGKVEKIHPIESLSQDLELLFQALTDQERLRMATVNDLDRFINSSTVSLLWQYGSSEDAHQLMHKMMNTRSVGLQTDPRESERRRHSSLTNDSNETLQGGEGGVNNDEVGDTQGSVYASGETGNATVVTKRQTIPASLRAQLKTRPKVPRVLEQDVLNRLILWLYLEKLDADARSVRARTPRTGLHAFMKQRFLHKYAIAPLADYHLMELVKSCLYYHEHQDAEHRRIKALGLPTSPLVGCYPLHDNSSNSSSTNNRQFSAADVRVALFSRVCELVPLELADVPVDGNLFSSLLDALVDMVGDVVEMDASVATLEQVLALPTESRWECATDVALALLAHHLIYAERTLLDDASARVAQLSSLSASTTSVRAASTTPAARVSVDLFLAIFASAWLEYDQRVTRKLRDGFRRQLVALAPVEARGDKAATAARARSESSSSSSRQPPPPSSAEAPLETLMRICAALPDEALSPLDLDALRTAFARMVERNSQPAAARSRRKTSTALKSHAAAPATVCIGGLSEKEFVATAVQLLRTRRTSFGVRTNSRPLSTAPTRLAQLGASRQLVALVASHAHDGDLPLEMLKPGLDDTAPPSQP
ncbi:hypothetical protein PybrP1_000810 [[Pythium] brassicae (nom. inval.)]|nr:hypothetical protein PybrP1_000810 [[Pythium] brassicae (nom. inval.)]